jgi:hypothetical protein
VLKRAEAVRSLQEALSSYRAYEHFVSQGSYPVHADDDPQDLVTAAEINVHNCVTRCRELGMSDEDMLAAVGPDAAEKPK